MGWLLIKFLSLVLSSNNANLISLLFSYVKVILSLQRINFSVIVIVKDFENSNSESSVVVIIIS